MYQDTERFARYAFRTAKITNGFSPVHPIGFWRCPITVSERVKGDTNQWGIGTFQRSDAPCDLFYPSEPHSPVQGYYSPLRVRVFCWKDFFMCNATLFTMRQCEWIACAIIAGPDGMDISISASARARCNGSKSWWRIGIYLSLMIAWYKTCWSAMWSFWDDIHNPCVRASMPSECHGKKPRQPFPVQIGTVTRKLIAHVVWRRLLGGLCNVLPKRSVMFHHDSGIPRGDTIWTFWRNVFRSFTEIRAHKPTHRCL